MKNDTPKILAINPGSKYLGTAVFQGPELRDWGIKIINRRGAKRKIETAKGIVSDLIDQYGTDVLVVKKLHASRTSSNLDKLVSEIKALAKKRGLRVRQYSLEAVESFFSESEKMNKRRMAEAVAEQYPFLLRELKREKTSRNPYHMRMFEAVALGMVCLHHLDKKH